MHSDSSGLAQSSVSESVPATRLREAKRPSKFSPVPPLTLVSMLKVDFRLPKGVKRVGDLFVCSKGREIVKGSLNLGHVGGQFKTNYLREHNAVAGRGEKQSSVETDRIYCYRLNRDLRINSILKLFPGGFSAVSVDLLHVAFTLMKFGDEFEVNGDDSDVLTTQRGCSNIFFVRTTSGGSRTVECDFVAGHVIAGPWHLCTVALDDKEHFSKDSFVITRCEAVSTG